MRLLLIIAITSLAVCRAAPVEPTRATTNLLDLVNSSPAPASPADIQQQADALTTALTNQLRALLESSTHAKQAEARGWYTLCLIVLALAGIVGIPKLISWGTNFFGTPTESKPRRRRVRPHQSDCEPATSEFSQPEPASAPLPLSEPEPANTFSPPAPLEPASRATAHTQRNSLVHLPALRKHMAELGRSQGRQCQQEALAALEAETRKLVASSAGNPPEPLHQFARAIAAYVAQLQTEIQGLETANLRTLASALDLVHSLSAPGVRPNVATVPEPRLLVVDDDPVSRYAVGAALHRFLPEPDTAIDGEAALVLAEKEHYDVIFLDVQMPGMDGFELCSRIHATAANHTTPVVFVTCRTDFDARTQSLLIGGEDLIGKPFRASEVSLKGLTVMLRRRLQGDAALRQVTRPITLPEKPRESESCSARSAGAFVRADPAIAVV